MNIQPADCTCHRVCRKNLPAGSREKVQQGYVIKTGPGYAIPMPMEEESWKGEEEQQVKDVPLQAKEGDLAIFLFSGATEVIPIAIGMKKKVFYSATRCYIIIRKGGGLINKHIKLSL